MMLDAGYSMLDEKSSIFRPPPSVFICVHRWLNHLLCALWLSREIIAAVFW